MHKTKRCANQPLKHLADTEFGRRWTCTEIVIPADQKNFKICPCTPPSIQLAANGIIGSYSSMHQVTQNKECSGTDRHQGPFQAFEVIRSDASRNGNAVATKSRWLSKMRIGDDQHFLFIPEDRPLGKQAQMLVFYS